MVNFIDGLWHIQFYGTQKRATMINREITKHLLKLAIWFPVVGITGPRQSGKTMLARAPQSASHPSSTRASAPRRQHAPVPPAVILSEVNVRPAHSRSRRIYVHPPPAHRSNLQSLRGSFFLNCELSVNFEQMYYY